MPPKVKAKKAKRKTTPSERKWRQYRWQLRQTASGRCRKCTRKLSRRSRLLCDAHLIRERERMRVRIGYAPEVAARAGKFRVGRKGVENVDLRIRKSGKKRPKKSRKIGGK